MTTDAAVRASTRPASPLRAARTPWQIFRRSVWAFMLRELKSKYLSTRLGALWAIADPAAFLLIFISLHSLMGGRESGIVGAAPEVFFFWGVLPYFMFSHAAMAANGAVRAAEGLLAYRQIQPLDIIIARVLIEGAVMLIVGVIAALAWWLTGHDVVIDDPLLALVFVMLLLLLGLSYGVFTEVMSTIYPDLRRVFALMMRPLLFISGLFFTMTMIPFGLESWLKWNPILHLVDLTRGAALAGYESPGDFLYAMGCMAAFLAIGLTMFHRHRDLFH